MGRSRFNSKLQLKIGLSSQEVNRRNKEDVISNWRRISGLETAITRFYLRMQEDVEAWDYNAQPFSLKRRDRGYHLALLLIEYKKTHSLKTKTAPIALIAMGYNKHHGAEYAIRTMFTDLLIKDCKGKADLKSGSIRDLLWVYDKAIDLAKLQAIELVLSEGESGGEATASGIVVGSASSTTSAASSIGEVTADSASSSIASSASSSIASTSPDAASDDLDIGDFGENAPPSDSYSPSYSTGSYSSSYSSGSGSHS